MSEQPDQRYRGPMMLSATRALNPGPSTIVNLGGGVKLPRPVEIRKLIAMGIGAFAMILPAFLFTGFNLRILLLSASLGGAIGWFLTSYSPLKGESMLTWLGLNLKSRRSTVTMFGLEGKLHIGICPVIEPARGAVRIVRGAVNIPPTQYDDRGVVLSEKNRNLHLAQDVPAELRPTPFGSVGGGFDIDEDIDPACELCDDDLVLPGEDLPCPACRPLEHAAAVAVEPEPLHPELPAVARPVGRVPGAPMTRTERARAVAAGEVPAEAAEPHPAPSPAPAAPAPGYAPAPIPPAPGPPAASVPMAPPAAPMHTPPGSAEPPQPPAVAPGQPPLTRTERARLAAEGKLPPGA